VYIGGEACEVRDAIVRDDEAIGECTVGNLVVIIRITPTSHAASSIFADTLRIHPKPIPDSVTAPDTSWTSLYWEYAQVHT